MIDTESSTKSTEALDPSKESSLASEPSTLTSFESVSSKSVSSDQCSRAMSAPTGVGTGVDTLLPHSRTTIRSRTSSRSPVGDPTSTKRVCLGIRWPEAAESKLDGWPHQVESQHQGQTVFNTSTTNSFVRTHDEDVEAAKKPGHGLFSSCPTSAEIAALWFESNDADETKKPAGSTWIWKRDGKLWPIMLCDDNIPPPAFVRTKHDQRDVAAILLGRRKYIWVRSDALQNYDPSENYLQGAPRLRDLDILRSDSDRVRDGKDRQRAFDLDGPLFETPQFWKNYIDNAREIRKLERAQPKLNRKCPSQRDVKPGAER